MPTDGCSGVIWVWPCSRPGCQKPWQGKLTRKRDCWWSLSVESGSPGESGGLLLGDTLLSLDGRPLRYPDDLVRQLGGERIGTSVPIHLVHGGQVQEISVAISENS